MLIQDLNYLETASDNIEGALANGIGIAGPSFANGVNVALTTDTSFANSLSQLVLFGPFIIPNNQANSAAASTSYSA